MKICNACEKKLPNEAFGSNGIGRLRSKCSPCERAYQRDYYNQNRQKRLTKNKKYREAATERNRQLIKDRKDAPCTDCGKRYPFYVMDFDHVRGTKVAGIAVMKNHGTPKLLEELAKCELVCSNCHRIRTWKHLDS